MKRFIHLGKIWILIYQLKFIINIYREYKFIQQEVINY